MFGTFIGTMDDQKYTYDIRCAFVVGDVFFYKYGGFRV